MTAAEHTCTALLTRFEPPVKRGSIPSTSEFARLHVPFYTRVTEGAVDETPGQTDSSTESVQSIVKVNACSMCHLCLLTTYCCICTVLGAGDLPIQNM